MRRLITFVHARLHCHRRRKSAANIRLVMALFGHDISAMTDEELEQAVVEAGRVLAQTGVTANECAAALVVFGCMGGEKVSRVHPTY